MTVNNYRIYGCFKTKSPLSHISESISTNSYLVQDPILQPDGEIEEVFAYNGNAWRGQLRDLSATYLLEKLGMKVDLDAFHLLFSGGKIGGDQSIDIAKAKLMRKVVPHISIFGGGIGTQIMQGKLKVGSSYPRCVEALPVLHSQYYQQQQLHRFHHRHPVRCRILTLLFRHHHRLHIRLPNQARQCSACHLFA